MVLRERSGQLEVDANDFPTPARTGLHSPQELNRTERITGKPIEAITTDGRPGNSSGAGFLADDEDILSVLQGDKRQRFGYWGFALRTCPGFRDSDFEFAPWDVGLCAAGKPITPAKRPAASPSHRCLPTIQSGRLPKADLMASPE